MENQSTRRLSRLFPSPFGSCRFRNVSDAVHNSILFTAGNSINSDCSSFRTSSSLSKPRKSSVPPANDSIEDPPKLKSFNSFTDSDRKNRSFCRETAKQSVFVKNSSSSNGGWFSSDEKEGEDEEVHEVTESFFSLSSVSSDSSPRRGTKTPISELGRRRLPNPVTETGEKTWRHHNKAPKSGRRRSNTAVAELGCRLFSDQVPEISKQSSILGEKNRGHRRKTPKPRRRSRSSCFPENPTDIFYSSSKNRRQNKRSNVRRCSLVVGDRIEESFAVMKASSDPHGDFRESMVDMIVEKEIYAIEDLQKLLDRFLSLNSSHHHGIILEVFSEICQALIAD